MLMPVINCEVGDVMRMQNCGHLIAKITRNHRQDSNCPKKKIVAATPTTTTLDRGAHNLALSLSSSSSQALLILPFFK